MADPEKIGPVMEVMERDDVREFMSDPRRVQQLMREVDALAIREAMRTVDMNKVRQAMAARWKAWLKQQLGASDEEWKVLEPRIDNLLRARQEVTPPGGGGRGRGFAFGGGGPQLPLAPRPGQPEGPSELQEAAAGLRAAMEDDGAIDHDVRYRLDVYRRARARARKKLEAAEQEVRDLLTLRQESILVVLGLLN